jgi:hypothetical protein
LIVLAYKSGAIVGVGRLDDLVAPSSQVYKYDVALAPYVPLVLPPGMFGWSIGVERWAPAVGEGHSCVRWTDTTATTFIVGDGDTDCDGFPDDGGDCAPSEYCDPTAPYVADGPDPCRPPCLMQQHNGMCATAMCVNGMDPSVATGKCDTLASPVYNSMQPPLCVQCDSACSTKAPVPGPIEFEQCVADMAPNPDAICNFDVNSNGTLCAGPAAQIQLQAPSITECAGARIVYPPMAAANGFMFLLANSVGTCAYAIDVRSTMTNLVFQPQRVVIGFPNYLTGGIETTVEVLVQPRMEPPMCVDECVPAGPAITTCM